MSKVGFAHNPILSDMTNDHLSFTASMICNRTAEHRKERTAHGGIFSGVRQQPQGLDYWI